VNDLLILLGKRVHELRAARNWSQEEFAHVSGLHRTYIGQIERGEKNISFGNLLKLSNVLGLTLSELFAGLENGAPAAREATPGSEFGSQKSSHDSHRMFEIQKLVTRLGVQRAAMDRTIGILGELAAGSGRSSKTARGHQSSRRERLSKK
jgi:transcriptional regulator with XRE-family HTH domain